MGTWNSRRRIISFVTHDEQKSLRCMRSKGQKWRNEMQALIDAETPQPERRSRMIASFNRGYRGYQQTYRTCTPAADLVIRRYLEEGSKLIRDVTARYAN